MIRCALFKTRLGWASIVAGEKGVKELILPRQKREELIDLVKSSYPATSFSGPSPYASQVKRFLSGRTRLLDLPLDLTGLSPFCRKVYRVTQAIPYGQTRTYQEIAKAVGKPKAARAVGNAMARNPLPLAIPCHRVIRSDGKLGGFGGGIKLKAALLWLEGGPIKSETVKGRSRLLP